MSDAFSAVKQVGTTGRDHYDGLYQTQLAEEAEWLDRTARCKADSIEQLIRQNGIECGTLLELGCGTGSVIRECHLRGLAKSYIAVDYSASAIDYLKAHSASDIKAVTADVVAEALPIDEVIDVVVVSHVIEHLENPATFLESLKRLKFRYLIAEVPLDDLLMGRLSALRVEDRTQNLAGHVQFFTGTTFETLLKANGFKILDRRRYLPMLDNETIRFVCRKNGSSRKTYYKMVLGRVLRQAFGPLWSHFLSAHYAVLAEVSR